MVSIEPDDVLYRRSHASAVDGDRVTRAAFMTNGQYDRELSVQLAKLLTSPQDCLRDRTRFGVGAIAVADVARLGFEVVPDPLPDDPAHALVIGPNSKQMARALARNTTIVIAPGTFLTRARESR